MKKVSILEENHQTSNNGSSVSAADVNVEEMTKYIFEVGHLKHTQRSGWTLVGIRPTESVAEHTYRAAIIGYVLASMAGANPERTAILCLFHDTAETRVTDLHWTAKRYLGDAIGEAEVIALNEQLSRLPELIALSIKNLVEEYEQRSTLEGLLSREADLLECVFQAREYQVRGYVEAEDWIDGCMKTLKTDIARRLADACCKMMPSEWFKGLKRQPLS